MLEDLRADFECTSDLSPGPEPRRVLVPGRIPFLLFYRSGLQALVAYRLGRWVRAAARRPARWPAAAGLAPAWALLDAWVRRAFDIHLDASAEIGAGLQIWHLGGIRLRGCRLGERCVIHQEVRVEPAPEGGAGPRLGDRVWVGPHARIVGPVHVGAGATVAAGAVVTRDVPPDSLVMGNPARVVRVGYDNAALRDRE
ncbi:serine acetyltransferase [Anaeromyxobacter diazotrophicus]|uniref:Serine O-acetyltransferase n=1 Tax=Anaeromyxobacter diazotrophicus TaxID=2590199 RepID=A0A7I9VMJ4_9BACT|nr:serine acetyltransferase [Anaeromyxobacter diazotrophicus]GEJ57614.1 hypothetical protein AMYX_23550 [Anaeromyxobacter diazotrophicus]